MQNFSQYLTMPGAQLIDPRMRIANQLYENSKQQGEERHWAQGLGRLANALAAGYLQGQSVKDMGTAQGAFQPEPDSYAMQPTVNDEQIMNSPEVQGLLKPKTDQDFMQNPMVQRNMNAIGYEQDRINQAEDRMQKINTDLTQGKFMNPQHGERDLEFERQAIANANKNIDQYSNEFTGTMGHLRGQQPTQDELAEKLAGQFNQQRDASMQSTLQEKMNPRDYAIQNLTKLAGQGNIYAKQLLMQMQMQGFDRDFQTQQANQQFDRQKELKQMPMGQKQFTQRKELATIPQNAPANLIKEYQQARGQGLYSGDFESYIAAKKPQFISSLDNLKAEKLQQENANYLTPAQKKVDEVFAKDYAETFVNGGVADARKNLAQLESVIGRLEGGKENLTGPIMGNMPDTYNEAMNPQMIDVKNTVEEVVQRNLRVILGAQFTEKEGTRLIARAYNPALDEATNAKRIRRLITAMDKALQSKEQAAQYYEKNGTLNGYKGTTSFSVGDFESAMGNENRRQGESNHGWKIERAQ